MNKLNQISKFQFLIEEFDLVPMSEYNPDVYKFRCCYDQYGYAIRFDLLGRNMILIAKSIEYNNDISTDGCNLCYCSDITIRTDNEKLSEADIFNKIYNQLKILKYQFNRALLKCKKDIMNHRLENLNDDFN